MYQLFFKDVPNFVKDVSRVPKSVPRWGMTFNHFPMVLKGINGLDVPSFFICVSKVLISVPGWGMTSNHFQGSPKEQTDHGKGNRGSSSLRIECIKFF